MILIYFLCENKGPPIQQPLQQQLPPQQQQQPVVSPNRTILLKNMFDPSQETGNTWNLEIQEDVSEECSKFGRVLHCFVDSNSMVFFLFFLSFFPFFFF